MERIYISGPVTGHEDYMTEFSRMERKVAALFNGSAVVINPAAVCAKLPEGVSWEECMKLCFVLVEMADGIYMMPDWQKSTGACIEYGYAKALGKQIYNA